MVTWGMQLRAVSPIPEIRPGDDLAAIIAGALAVDGDVLSGGDVIVVAQKAVSKAEGRVVALRDVTAGPEALELARRTGRDPRLCQLILDESSSVEATLKRHIVTVDRRGIVDTSAGVDTGNTGTAGSGHACLLPAAPDASARRIRDGIRRIAGIAPAVIVSDSLGNPWREGSHGAAIGIAGIAALEKPAPGDVDRDGNLMRGEINRVDELAGAASVLMGQGAEGRPVVLIRGAVWTPSETARIRDLLVPDPAGSFPLAQAESPG